MAGVLPIVRRWSAGLTTLILAITYVAFIVNIFFPGVRFTFAIGNYLAFGAAQLIPVGILWTARRASGWRRICSMGIGLVLCLPAAPFGLGAAACVMLVTPTAQDASFERLHVESNASGTVAVYRSNGGATTAWGIDVRQECPIVPGLVVVRPLAGDYPADEAAIELENGTAVIRIETDQERLPDVRPRFVRLRRFCWGPEQ
jgi:hypothetical protein